MTRCVLEHVDKGFFTRYNMTQDRAMFSPHRDQAEVFTGISWAMDMLEMIGEDENKIEIVLED